MSVPLDRLYNFLHDVCNHDDVLIYRFCPHGSKKVRDCHSLTPHNTNKLKDFSTRRMVCHDQEPLSRSYYNKIQAKIMHRLVDKKILMYDKILLLHSEMHSAELQQFEQEDAIGVYWWCHAMIARDWFRYADVDPALSTSNFPIYDFLVYNRAWSGTREYRLKFSELILDSNLISTCFMNFSVVDEGHDYRNHQFKNQNLKIQCHDLEKYFRPNNASACFSADYDSRDYNQCAIEIVLETLFDDTRWHLTEKSLRPIACGKPFMLAATPGSLDYLRRYGFKTFSPWIDEYYDTVQDPVQRLQEIVKSMQKFSSQPEDQKQQALLEMQSVCEYNKTRFFSKEFMQTVIDEFVVNFQHGIEELEKHQGTNFKKLMRSFGSTERAKMLFSRQELVELWLLLHKSGSY